MNGKFEFSKIEGDWIIQRTNYSLLNGKLRTSTDQMTWKNLKNVGNTTENVLEKLLLEYSTTNYEIYITNLKTKNRTIQLYKFFLYNNEFRKGKIIKLDEAGNVISKANFQYPYNNYLLIKHEHNNFFIKESIYFINDNLKIIKSVIEKNEKCIAISFASEIKIY